MGLNTEKGFLILCILVIAQVLSKKVWDYNADLSARVSCVLIGLGFIIFCALWTSYLEELDGEVWKNRVGFET